MKAWWKAFWLLHGLPMFMGYVLYKLVTWEGRIMENIVFIAIAVGLVIVFDWWRNVFRGAK